MRNKFTEEDYQDFEKSVLIPFDDEVNLMLQNGIPFQNIEQVIEEVKRKYPL